MMSKSLSFNHENITPPTGNWLDQDQMEEQHPSDQQQRDMEEEPLHHTKSIRSTRSTARSTRSMTSRTSFHLLDTIGGPSQEEGAAAEEEAIIMEMLRSGAPVPPDGGYGWVIVFVSFVCNLVLDGITCTFGVFLPQMVIDFGAGKGQVAWAGSVLCGGALCVGPIVGALTNKYGCRIVCVCGSLIGCIGFIVSSFADSLALMLFSYGILGAVGFGLIYLPNIVSVGYYFEKRRAMATGIAVCGSGFGATTFAPMASWLTSQTSWRNVNLIYAGLIFLCGCFGTLIRPLEIKREAIDDFTEGVGLDPDPKRRPLLYRMAEEKRHHLENSIAGSEYFMVQLPDGTMERRQKMPLNVDPGVHSSFHLDQFTNPHTPGAPMTPVHAPLSTIAETENKQESESDGVFTRAGTKGLKTGESKADEINSKSRLDDEVESERPGIDIPRKRTHHDDIMAATGGAQSPIRSSRKLSLEDLDDVACPHRSAHHRQSYSSNDWSVNNNEATQYSLRAVPASFQSTLFQNLFSSTHSRRDSISSTTGSRKGSIGSTDEGIQFGCNRNECPSIHPSLRHSGGGSIAGSITSVQRIIRPLSRKDIFYSGSITHLVEYQNQTSYRQSILQIPPDEPDAPGSPSQKPVVCSGLRAQLGAFITAMLTFMDFSLLKNPVFICIASSAVIGMLGFYTPFVYIIDFCAEKGIARDDAALLISIIGIMNTIGRVGFGFISDLPQINSLYLNNICLFGMGAAVVTVPFCSTFSSLIVIYVLFGLFLSGFVSLTSITLVDLLGLENLTNSFGLLIFFRGFASIIGSPFAGFLYDTFQTYDVPFFLAGGFLTASSLISCTIPWISQFAPPKKPLVVKPPPTPFQLEGIPEASEASDEDLNSDSLNEPVVEDEGENLKELQLFTIEEDTVAIVGDVTDGKSTKIES